MKEAASVLSSQGIFPLPYNLMRSFFLFKNIALSLLFVSSLYSYYLDRRRFNGYSLSGKPVSRKFLSSNECKEAGTHMKRKLDVRCMNRSTRVHRQGMTRLSCCLCTTNSALYHFYLRSFLTSQASEGQIQCTSTAYHPIIRLSCMEVGSKYYLFSLYGGEKQTLASF
jgi:hypothetical protein